MHIKVRNINRWFSTATRGDVNDLLSKIILTERQTRIFEMFYLKRQTIGYIADTLGASQPVICRELNVIRNKISTIIQ